MRQACWELSESNVRVWLTDTQAECRADYYPLLSAWITCLLDDRPYVLEDSLSDRWLETYASSYQGLVVYVRLGGRHSYVLMGANGPAVLHAHLDGCPDSWIAGLHVHVFGSADQMHHYLRQVEASQEVVSERKFKPMLFTAAIEADAECLVITPGTASVEQILSMTQHTAALTKFDWVPLRT